MTATGLYLREYGAEHGRGTPLVLLHGLFGSSANWHTLARRFADSRAVLAPDLRNHGRSPGGGRMTYADLGGDVAGMLEARGIGKADLVGHSMGGKAAMWLALSRPELVRALVVVDIAPVRYPDRFSGMLEAMRRLDLDGLTDRREADAKLAGELEGPVLRGYLLQNLVREDGVWRWRIDLEAIGASLDDLLGFPTAGGGPFPGAALFVYGTRSDYVSGAHLPAIRALFPMARLRAVPGAGHWVYADEPDAFARALEGFLPN